MTVSFHKQDAQQAKTRQAFTPSGQVGMPLKCKVGYGGEDAAVIETRCKFQNMSVDKQNNMQTSEYSHTIWLLLNIEYSIWRSPTDN
jgi:hypothetical protein